MYPQNENGQLIVSSERFSWIAIASTSIAFILTCKLSTKRVKVEEKEEIQATK